MTISSSSGLALTAGRSWTYNRNDFLRIAARGAEASRAHPGIIISHYQYTRDETRLLVEALRAFVEEHSAEQVANSVQYGEATSVRDAHE
jgi:hypothetical protein